MSFEEFAARAPHEERVCFEYTKSAHKSHHVLPLRIFFGPDGALDPSQRRWILAAWDYDAGRVEMFEMEHVRCWGVL